MSEWKEYKLGEIADVRDGTHDSPKQVEYGKPLVTSKHIKGGRIELSSTYLISFSDFEKINKRSKVDKSDILFSMIGTIGEMVIVNDEPDFAIKNVGLFKTSDFNLSKWIYYYLKSPIAQNELLASLKGSTQQYISLTDLRNFPIKLPPVDVRDAIAEILSSLDDKIELNNQINKDLEALAQALFKQWFIDFEFPNENGEPYRSSGGEMVDSELGEIPKGWKVGILGEYAKTTSGGTPSRAKTEYYENGKFHWVKSKELNNSMIFETEEKINEFGLKNSSAKLLPPYSVLIAMYGATVGQFGLIVEEATCNQAICAVLPSESLPYSFNYLFFQNYRKEFANLAVGSAQQNISQDLIKNTKLVMPPKKSLFEFHSIVGGLLKTIENNCRENKDVEKLRNTLLPKLISGELEVSDIQTKTL